MWCPKCRNEYRKGITVCADCGCALVESLEEYDREQTMKAADEENAALLRVQEAQAADYETDADEADSAAPVSHAEETPAEPVISIRAASGTPERKRTYAYRDSDEKAEENKSSAYALLGVGIVGLVFIILLFLGKISFLVLEGANRYFVCGVMGVMFILFIVMGVVSMKSFKRLKAEAASEHSIEDEIRKWCGENIKADEIDAVISENEDTLEINADSSETAYFARTAVIRDRINMQFVGLDEAFLDHFVDDYYSTLYGEAKTVLEDPVKESEEDID